MQSKAADEQRHLAALYLAWVFRYARAWVYKNHSALVADRKIIWEANIGVPAGTWAKSGDFKRNYDPICAVAWWLSQRDPSTWLKSLAKGFSDNSLAIQKEIDIGYGPEFAAQIAGYMASAQRRDEALHLLVDVGAGTLDVACFRVRQDASAHQDVLPVFSSQVEPLGTYYLMAARYSAIGRMMTDWSPSHDVPEKDVLANALGVSSLVFKKADDSFSKKVFECVVKVIRKAQAKHPNSPEFCAAVRSKAELSVFFSGGGGELTIYQSAVMAALKSLNVRFSSRLLPRDQRIPSSISLSESLATRLSVATGLTSDLNDWKLYSPQEITKFVPITMVRERPDRDELYPK
jgi:hypothetical protein